MTWFCLMRHNAASSSCPHSCPGYQRQPECAAALLRLRGDDEHENEIQQADHRGAERKGLYP